jgi:hypothetical protein
VIVFHNFAVRDGITQITIGTIMSPSMVLVQFNGLFMIDEVGSNTENRLVIIFRSFLLI